MAKKSGAPKGGMPGVAKKDDYERISYLYQASHKALVNPKLQILSRGYSRNATLVSKKSVLKLTPGIKRRICKKCNTILVPGLSLSVRLENNSKSKSANNDILVYKCTNCETVKRFPVGRNREYKLFSDEAMVKYTL